MPSIVDTWYGTDQSLSQGVNRHLLRMNDALLDRLNAVEAYHGLPASTWYAGAGKPSVHGIPHYMVTTSEGDEYIRDRVDFIRDHAGAPAFPWETVPDSGDYWGKSGKGAIGVPPLTELTEAMGRITGGTALLNRYEVSLRWNGSTYYDAPLIVRNNIGSLSSSDPRRRRKLFETWTTLPAWRRRSRVIGDESGEYGNATELQWVQARYNPYPGQYAVDLDTEDPDNWTFEQLSRAFGSHTRYPDGGGWPTPIDFAARSWDYSEELSLSVEGSPFGGSYPKRVEFPIWLAGAEAGFEGALTPLELAYLGSSAWTTDTGGIPEGGSEGWQTELSQHYRDFAASVAVSGYTDFGSTLQTFYSQTNGGSTTKFPLPEIEIVILGSDSLPNTLDDYASGTPDYGVYRWPWPTTAGVIGPDPIVSGVSPSANYSQWKDHVEEAVAVLRRNEAGTEAHTKNLTGTYQEIYYEGLRKNYSSESGSTWLYWLRPELLEVATRPA